jgi:hypothetical protein
MMPPASYDKIKNSCNAVPLLILTIPSEDEDFPSENGLVHAKTGEAGIRLGLHKIKPDSKSQSLK